MEGRNKPGFLKIVPKENLSTESTRKIPSEFLRRISEENGQFSFKMVLKMRWGGKSRPIQISKTQKFYYMEKSGWDQFVNDNGLVENEVVTFTHMENIFVAVNIYQSNGVELLKPRKSLSSSSSTGKKKTEQVISMNIDVKIEDSDSNSTTVQSTRRRKNPNQEEINKKSEESKKKKKKKEKIDDVSSSLIPEFTVTVTKTYLKFLVIPTSFLKRHMPEETKDFRIHHENGKKSWDVVYLVTDEQSRISTGWARLAREYPLKVGDVCTFKLIKPTEMLLEVSRRAKE